MIEWVISVPHANLVIFQKSFLYLIEAMNLFCETKQIGKKNTRKCNLLWVERKNYQANRTKSTTERQVNLDVAYDEG